MSTTFDGEIVCVDRGGHWQFDCSFPQSVILVVPAASCLGNARPNQATGIPRRGSDALRRGFRARAQRRARSSAEIRAVRRRGRVGGAGWTRIGLSCHDFQPGFPEQRSRETQKEDTSIETRCC